mmetsp:Transcript_5303/g.5536  ORF Transcript_5303/g.5536 Transcript_5303/m.5536 type:complete len:127 (-) Transcript_5303:64-444(-)
MAFSCGIHLKIIGRAVCIDLSEESDFLESVCSIQDPHVTVLFRKRGQWLEEELQQFVEFRDQWLQRKGQPVEGGRCEFVGNRKWGKSSNHIDGELCQFVTDAREALMEHMECSEDQQRKPHVAVRR